MAALIDATTGYNVITDYGDDSLENPFTGSFPGAATGPQPYDDFNEVNSGEDFLDSGASLENPFSITQPQGIVWDVGATVYRNVYVKSFEEQTAPRLGFSSSFAYFFALILTWIVNLYSALAFHGDSSKTGGKQFLAFLSSVGTFATSKVFNRIFSAALSFIGSVSTRTRKAISGAVSFIGNITAISPFQAILTAAVSFVGAITTIRGKVFQATIRLHGLIVNPFRYLVTRIVAAIFPGRQHILGLFLELQPTITGDASELSIGTAPTLLTLPLGPLRVLAIFNLDLHNTVQVDSSSAFNVFPQKIPPRKAVYLSPSSTTVYVRSISGASAIKIIYAR